MEFYQHVALKNRVVNRRAKLRDQRIDLAVLVVAAPCAANQTALHKHDLSGFERGFCSLGIGADKSARSEEHAAEIARDHNANVVNLVFENNVKHRHSGSSRRLAVVAVTLDIALS